MVSQTRTASRSGRYRKKLMEPEAFQPFANGLARLFLGLDALRVAGTMSDAEFTGYGLIAMLGCRRPDALQPHGPSPVSSQGKEQALANGSAFSPSHFLLRLRESGIPVQNEAVPWRESTTLIQFVSRIRFRGIPDSAHRALMEWLKDRYPLALYFHSPPADEVFEMQKAGSRCITFFQQAGELTRWHQGRDALSFLVHDLIHAHEFYSDPLRARQQIGFYHWLESIRNQDPLLDLVRSSPSFQARWEYVLADMNSYCGHLLQTLHAAFLQEAPPGEGGRYWAAVVQASRLSETQKSLFLRVNSDRWDQDAFLELERIFEEMAEQGRHLLKGQIFSV